MSAADSVPSPYNLVRQIEDYLTRHPTAALLEDGRVLFDLRMARYSVTESHGRCLVQFWSEERNLIRSVIDVQERAQYLRILTRKMGANRPQALELVPTSDRRTPTARDAARRNYLRLLERALSRTFPGCKVDGLRSAMDLEHSFGPAYVRGRLLRGTSSEAVIGVGAAESSATIDGILTLGILWLDYCRLHSDGRRHFGALKVVVPPGASRTTAERMAWLNPAMADFQLFTLDERTEEMTPVDLKDNGNLETRLVHAYSTTAALERCRAGIDRMMRLLPPGAKDRVELVPRSTTEVALLLHGLEFARVRHTPSSQSFAKDDEITFGAGANETPLTQESESLCAHLLQRLFLSRHPDGVNSDALFRMQPERWLESRLRLAIGEILPELRGDLIYSQVPALSSGDRGMLDLLTVHRNGRLVVIEVKANEDLHLPLQALDYWMRVHAVNLDRKIGEAGRPLSALERQGYFVGSEVSVRPPTLLLIAPALRIHPANEQVLRSLSPEIEWELLAVSENWRHDLSVVFRKRSTDSRH
jgi:hypothetical protein